jgi:hypothetical protein
MTMNNEALETIITEIDGLKAYIKTVYDDTPVEDMMDFVDDEDRRTYLDKFNSGDLINVTVMVEVFSRSGEVSGSDNLGACHVNTGQAFEDVQEIVKDHGMLENAKDDLERILKAIKLQDLTPAPSSEEVERLTRPRKF